MLVSIKLKVIHLDRFMQAQAVPGTSGSGPGQLGSITTQQMDPEKEKVTTIRLKTHAV